MHDEALLSTWYSSQTKHSCRVKDSNPIQLDFHWKHRCPKGGIAVGGCAAHCRGTTLSVAINLCGGVAIVQSISIRWRTGKSSPSPKPMVSDRESSIYATSIEAFLRGAFSPGCAMPIPVRAGEAKIADEGKVSLIAD